MIALCHIPIGVAFGVRFWTKIVKVRILPFVAPGINGISCSIEAGGPFLSGRHLRPPGSVASLVVDPQ